MTEPLLSVELTRAGKPALWVGGGSTTSRFSASFVMRNGKLATACFIKVKGHRCCGDQALVPIQVGDIYVGITGTLPASPENPVISVKAWRILEFDKYDGEPVALCNDVDFNVEDVPPSVWEGANIYHNREGRYFVAESE